MEQRGRKSLRKITLETGMVALFGFAGGWAITKTILDIAMPNDPNRSLYAALVGVGTGTALAVSSSGLTIGWTQTK